MLAKQAKFLIHFLEESRENLKEQFKLSNKEIGNLAKDISKTLLSWGKMIPEAIDLNILKKKKTKDKKNEHLIGRKGVVKKTITAKDLDLFKEVSLDDNRLHFDDEYAKTTRFKKRIAHGYLTASLISAAVGSKLFTENIVYKTQDFNFLRPVFIGDTITASAEVVDVDGDVLKLETICVNQKGKEVIRGEGEILLYDMTAED